MTPAILLDVLYTRGDVDPDSALDVLFSWVDDDLRHGGLRSDELLELADISRLNEDMIVGVMCITYSGKRLLSKRGAFAERARIHLAAELGRNADALIGDLL